LGVPGLQLPKDRRYPSGLAYRIQELAYGGLSRQTLERLQAMAKQYATRDAAERKARPVHRPISGTKLIREWQGIEHCVTVRADDFEYLGRPYKSLSSVAHEITGTKWNGWVFFGLKNHQHEVPPRTPRSPRCRPRWR
jgi:Protein of unknown function (DUF2924)